MRKFNVFVFTASMYNLLSDNLQRDKMASALVVDRASDGDDDDGLEVLVINGRTLSVKENLSSKSKLNIYSQKFQLGKPEYRIRVVDENHTVLRKFISTVELEGKSSHGTGTSKKRAEVAASRKYCNNIFLGGGRSLLLGKQVRPSKIIVPSNKKRKDKIKMDRFMEMKRINNMIRKKKTRDAAEDDLESPDKEDTVLPGEVQGEVIDVPVAVASLPLAVPLEFDLERSWGADDSEIIQLGTHLDPSQVALSFCQEERLTNMGQQWSIRLELLEISWRETMW